MVACGAAAGHCCWLGQAGVCPFLRDDGDADRRWVCTLRERLGSWAAVHADLGYQARVAPTMRAHGQVDCGDWPGPGVTCGECGVSGDG